MLRLEGVDAGYGAVQVLRGLNLTAQAGEVTCVMGRNGAGKSTLMKCIMGLVPARAGRITLGGTALTGGRFSLVGSVIGALIIQTLTYAIYSLGVPPEINLVVKAVVVFIVMLLQSPEFRAQVGDLARRPGAGALQ